MFGELTKLSEEIDGVVIYTDGSSSGGGSGYTGGGIHGYTFKNDPPKKGIGLGKYKAGKEGYTMKEDEELVTVVEYFDATMSTHYGTNNTAELKAGILGMRIAAFFAEKGVKKITIRADSEYFIKGVLTYMPYWERNNWIKANGQPVANMDIWKLAAEAKKLIDEHGIEFSINWVQGHIGEPGNEAADRNALVGKTLNGVRKTTKDEDVHGFVVSEPAGYWKNNTEEKVSMLQGSVIIFDANKQHPADNNRYFIFTNSAGDGTNDLSIFGIADESAGYGIVQLKEPSYYLNDLMSHQEKSLGDEVKSFIDGSLYAGINTRPAFSPIALSLYPRHKTDVMIPIGDLNELFVLGKENLSKVIYPIKMALDGISILNSLDILFEEYISGRLKDNKMFNIIDVTTCVYDMTKTSKSVTYKLKEELNLTTGKLDLCAYFPELKTKSVLNAFILSFGSDMPRREIVSAAAKKEPTAKVIYWDEAGSFKRAFVLETDEGVGIWHNPWRSIF